MPVVLAGYQAILADMAGLRATEDPVEREGVRRALAWAEQADLRLWLKDLTRLDAPDPTAELCKPGDWIIGTKADLIRAPLHRLPPSEGGWTVLMNSNNAEEVAALRQRLADHLLTALQGRSFPATTRNRHRVALAAGVEALTRAIDGVTRGPELFGEDLRLAARALERVTGRIDAEKVLDEVFASFCIGK